MELILRGRSWYGVSRARSRRDVFPARPSPAPVSPPTRREPSVAELEEMGLGVMVRPFMDLSNREVCRVYCLTCGLEIDPSRRHDDSAWAMCPQGCNAALQDEAPSPP